MGTIVVRKLIQRHIAEGHNDVLVPLFLTAGVIYAVLPGFMVVGEWESYDAARANAGEEAAVLVPLYRQTSVMDAHCRDETRKVLREYAEHVARGWQRFANGERNRQAGHDANATPQRHRRTEIRNEGSIYAARTALMRLASSGLRFRFANFRS